MQQLLELVPTEIDDLARADANRLTREAVELVRSGDPHEASVEVRESYADDLPDVMVDPEKISRVVDNLVRNAFAHTPAGGTVEILTRTIDGDVEIEIANTGSYVAPEDRERIFQPFVSGRQEGTGLGLAIAQQIVYAHGGSLRVESDPDTGTSFTVRLPPLIEEDAPEAAPERPTAATVGT